MAVIAEAICSRIESERIEGSKQSLICRFLTALGYSRDYKPNKYYIQENKTHSKSCSLHRWISYLVVSRKISRSIGIITLLHYFHYILKKAHEIEIDVIGQWIAPDNIAVTEPFVSVYGADQPAKVSPFG